jgi:hypothetical protein
MRRQNLSLLTTLHRKLYYLDSPGFSVGEPSVDEPLPLAVLGLEPDSGAVDTR